MPASTLYLACYDVTDDAERERVCGVLEGYGLRVQKSVFECRLTRSARERLLLALGELKIESGFLYLYKLGSELRRQSVGNIPDEPFADERHSFVV
jgi:CRISPR-associated protein Cas2